MRQWIRTLARRLSPTSPARRVPRRLARTAPPWVMELEPRLVPSPVANDDSYSTHFGHTLTVSAPGVLANDTGGTLSAIDVSLPTHGTMSLGSNGSLTYFPSGGYVGTDSFTYKAFDGHNVSNTATITINVTDTAPVAVNDSYSVAQNTTLTVLAASGVLANDSDADGDAIAAAVATGPAHGSLTLGSNGSITYVPNTGFRGLDSFTYKDSDGALSSSAATVTIAVDETAPVANNDAYVLHGGSLSVSAPGVLGNDTDAEGDSLTASLVSGPAHGSLTLNSNGSLSYTPGGGFAGSDSFTYQANDGFLNSNTATVTINAPTLTASGASLTATAGVSTGSVTVATGSDTDLALSGSSFSAMIQWGDGTSTSIPASSGNGIVHNSDGTFSIPAGHTYGFWGPYTVSVSVQDTVNSLTASASTTVTVANPVSLTNPGTQSSTEGGVSLALSASDSVSGTLSYAAVGLPPGLSINTSSGAITGTVAAGDAHSRATAARGPAVRSAPATGFRPGSRPNRCHPPASRPPPRSPHPRWFARAAAQGRRGRSRP